MSESRRSFFRNATVLGAGLMTWAEGLRAQKSAKADANERTSRAPAKERSGLHDGRRYEGLSLNCRAGETQNRSLEDARHLGLQRKFSRTHDSGATGRPRPIRT